MKTPEYIACSECFNNQGIKLMATGLGSKVAFACTHCGSSSGSQLTKDMLYNLAHSFFVQGSYRKVSFGGASVIQFNDYHSDKSMEFEGDINKDAKLITRKLNVGFFPYGTRLWMVGEIEPLKSLQSENERSEVIERILSEYPEYILNPGVNFYRLL